MNTKPIRIPQGLKADSETIHLLTEMAQRINALMTRVKELEAEIEGS
jgi:hypothetical protein